MEFFKRGVSYATVIGVVTLLGCAQPTDSERSSDILSHRNLGLAHLEENHIEAAQAEFTRLIEALPGDPLGYANLGLTYLRDDDPERALVQIQKALTLDPNNPALRLILAEVYQAQRNDDQARREFLRVVEQAPRHLVAQYKLVELYARAQDDTERQEGMTRHLQAIVEASPGNVAARLRLVQILLEQGQSTEAGDHLETLRLQIPSLTKQAADYLQRALDRLGESNAKQARTAALIFHNLMRPTSVYRGGIAELKEGGGLVGFPVTTFGAAFRTTLETKTSILDRVRFVEAGESWSLNLEAERIDGLATLDYDNDGNLDLAAVVDSRIRLFRNEGSGFREVTEEVKLDDAPDITQAISVDYDNDGPFDLFLTGSAGNRLYHNDGNGLFIDVTQTAGVAGPAAAQGALFFDADHEGDLDLLVLGRAGNTYYQNNRDGRFTDVSQRTDLGADIGMNSLQAAIGDFDEDGDIDVVLANRAGPMRLYTNLRQGHFQEIGREAGATGHGVDLLPHTLTGSDEEGKDQTLRTEVGLADHRPERRRPAQPPRSDRRVAHLFHSPSSSAARMPARSAVGATTGSAPCARTSAAVVSPIGLLARKGKEYRINDNQPGPVARQLFDELTGIQYGLREDRFGWVVAVE